MSDAVTNVTRGGSWGPRGTMTPAAKHEGTKYHRSVRAVRRGRAVIVNDGLASRRLHAFTVRLTCLDCCSGRCVSLWDEMQHADMFVIYHHVSLADSCCIHSSQPQPLYVLLLSIQHILTAAPVLVLFSLLSWVMQFSLKLYITQEDDLINILCLLI